jgi:hypothetical protein
MALFHHAVASGSLDFLLDAFAAAHGFSDADLAHWLEVRPEQLTEIGALPAPTPYSKTYLQDCAAIVAATGCDAWALDVALLWTSGKR